MSLLPEELREKIIQVRGSRDLEFWTIGDCAAVMHAEAAGNTEKWLAYRDEIADLAGVTPAVVTEYKRAAQFYSEKIRARFPTLTRWHFRTAMRAGEQWRLWLDEAANSADDYGGHPMPVRVMMAKMNGAGNEPRPNDWVELVVQRHGGLRMVYLPDEITGQTVKVKAC